MGTGNQEFRMSDVYESEKKLFEAHSRVTAASLRECIQILDGLGKNDFNEFRKRMEEAEEGAGLVTSTQLVFRDGETYFYDRNFTPDESYMEQEHGVAMTPDGLVRKVGRIVSIGLFEQHMFKDDIVQAMCGDAKNVQTLETIGNILFGKAVAYCAHSGCATRPNYGPYDIRLYRSEDCPILVAGNHGYGNCFALIKK